ncbi:MAG: DUF1801 domain-containing protein [Pseudomonadota bacterium]
MPSSANVESFLSGVRPPKKAEDTRILDAVFRRTTGFAPVVWGASILGYGQYRYRYASRAQGHFSCNRVFAPKIGLVDLHNAGLRGFWWYPLRIGKHKLGKSCLYVNKLADIDLDVLSDLIRAGLEDLERQWPVEAT